MIVRKSLSKQEHMERSRARKLDRLGRKKKPGRKVHPLAIKVLGREPRTAIDYNVLLKASGHGVIR